MRTTKRLLIAVICTTLLYLSSCQKTDHQLQQLGTAQLTVQDRFLRSNRSADPEENALVEFILRANTKHPFIEATVAKIGYPRWDKTVKRKKNVKTAVRVGTLSTNGVSPNAQEIVSDEYYVPFVRDSDNHVNAAMIITASPTDTTFRYLCDWQYKRQSNDINKITDNAENFAIFFMYLDRAVFDRTEFSITDTTIFRQNGHAPDRVTLMGSKVDSGVHTNMQYVETCMDVKIWWYYCPYIARGGFCTGPNGTCDKCGDSCPLNMIADTFCWGDWVDTNTSGGDGSNGTDVGSVPPDPCDGSGSPQNVDGTNNPRSGGRVQVNSAQNCSSDPGWSPSPSPGGGVSDETIIYDENTLFNFGEDKSPINLQDYFRCFDNIPDAGAVYSVMLCADIPINSDPYAMSTGAFVPGHTFISLTKSNGSNSITQTFGFYPVNGLLSASMLAVSSKIVDDGQPGQEHEYNASITLPNVSQLDFLSIQHLALGMATSQKYDLNDFNCTSYGVAAFNFISPTPLPPLPVIKWKSAIPFKQSPNGLYLVLQSMAPSNANISIGTFKAPTSHGPCN